MMRGLSGNLRDLTVASSQYDIKLGSETLVLDMRHVFIISFAHQTKIHNLRYCTSEWCWMYLGVIVFLAKIYIMIFNSCPFICYIIFALASDLLLAAGLEEFALEISTVF